MQSRNEVTSLTGLRGVAALYVLLFHYFPLTAVTTPFKRLLDHGYLAVDLFFVLSGFVMAMNYSPMFASGCSKATYFRFIGRRIARIYPLYLAATGAGFLLILFGWLDYTRATPLGLALVLNLSMIQAWGFVPSFDSPAWSISAEWAAYLLFPALLIPSMFRKPLVGWLCASLCAGMLAALCSLPKTFVPDYLVQNPLNFNGFWLAFPVLRCVPEFVLGILSFRLAATPAGKRMGTSRWFAATVSLMILGLLTLPKSDLAVVLLFPVLIVSLISSKHFPGRILSSPAVELLGKLSFSIYLVHKLLLGLLTWIDWRVHAAGIAHSRTYAAAICITLTFGLATFAYRTIEAPGRRWLRVRFEGQPKQNLARPVAVSTF